MELDNINMELDNIKVNNKISESKIKIRTKELAYKISNDFQFQDVHFLIIMNGAFIFASDLLREIYNIRLLGKIYIDSIKLSSYDGIESKDIKFDYFSNNDLNNENVIIIDDIFDTGNTTLHTYTKVNELFKPKRLAFCYLLIKEYNKNIYLHNFLSKFNYGDIYIGFKIPNIFVVGYGLDYNDMFRELPYIIELQEDK